MYLAIGSSDVNGPPRERVLYQGDKPANAGEAKFDHWLRLLSTENIKSMVLFQGQGPMRLLYHRGRRGRW